MARTCPGHVLLVVLGALGALGACGDSPGVDHPARLRLTPTHHSFGSVPVGQRDTLTATLTNLGGDALGVSELRLSDDSSLDFSVVPSAPLPWTLGAGERRDFAVVFAPLGAGSHRGVVEVTSSDGAQASLLLSTLDLAPRLAVEPAAVDFGLVEPGASASQELALRNDGAADLLLLAIRQSGAATLQLAPLFFPLVLQAGQLASATVSFTPTACGGADGAIEFVSNDAQSPTLSVPMEGHTPGPSLRLGQAAFDFGLVPEARSAPATLRLKSRGTEPVTLTALRILDTADGLHPTGAQRFTLPDAPALPFTLAPGESLALALAFTPMGAAQSQARLVVESSDCGEAAHEVVLQGRGTTDAGPTCLLTPSPTTLDFGALPQDATRDLVVDVTSTGSGPCLFVSSEVSTLGDRGFEVAGGPAPGAVAQPGERLTFALRFSPLGATFRGGRFFVNAIDPSQGNNPVTATVQLAGYGGAATVQVEPDLLDFGTVRVGCVSKTKTLRLTDVGLVELVLRRAQVAGGALPFELLPPLPAATLAPGTSTQARLRYRPTAAGPRTDVFVIESNDLVKPRLEIPLWGNGHEGPIVVEPLRQDEAPRVDFLFVVDNSGSMREEQAELERSFSTFAERAVRQAGSYQLGVITTDTPTLRGSPSLVRSTSADPVGLFRRNVRVGTSGSGLERGFEMARQALAAPLINTTNADLLRPHAALELIFVSDEDDQSDATDAAYLSFFAGRTDGRVRISAIVGPDRTGCSSASGLAEPGSRYLRAARQTGGVIGSICDADFGTTLAAIGETAFTLRDRLPLTADPDPSQPMTVRVYPSSAACDADPDAEGGALLAEGTGWRYDAASNEVFFTAAGIPPRGACALVRYTIMCLPYIP